MIFLRFSNQKNIFLKEERSIKFIFYNPMICPIA
nr:MAG TPA: hypothetical protein [Bacteriophage sp.]